MSGSNYTYTATSRIPIRPLSLENSKLALPKELIIDYKSGTIHICDLDGKIVNITKQILDNVSSMISETLNSSSIKETIRDINITLDSGNTVTIEDGIVQLFTDLLSTSNQLNTTNDELNKAKNTIPTPSTTTPKASTEKGSTGTQEKVFALADHEHPKGLATVADSAKSVEWENVKNQPDLSKYYEKSGGDINGEIGLLNDNGLYGYATDNAKAYIVRIDENNIVHIGHDNSNPILLDANIILNPNNYGEDDPNDVFPEGEAVEGQIYFQLI